MRQRLWTLFLTACVVIALWTVGSGLRHLYRDHQQLDEMSRWYEAIKMRTQAVPKPQGGS